jgi:large subunit ribosomal protein L25
MAKLERVTTLTLHPRARTGTTGAKAARREGNVPGILYGHGSPVSIAVASRDLADLLATGGQSHIVDATLEGKHDSVLLRDVQRHPISHRPIAADFQRVSQTEEIYATVPIVTVGVAPGVKDDGGVMDTVTHALEIKGPAGKLPEELTVDVSALGIGGHILASQVALPAGFTLVTGGETTVVSVELTRAIAGENAPAEPVADAATAPAAGA